MAQRNEIAAVYVAGVIQGVALVTFPAASAVFTSASDYALSSLQYGAMFVPQAVTAIGSLKLDVRMESWLPTDTIRRSGFGHIIVNRRHVLAIDRGISLVALAGSGTPLLTEYRSGLFAPVRRWVVNRGDSVAAPCYR